MRLTQFKRKEDYQMRLIKLCRCIAAAIAILALGSCATTNGTPKFEDMLTNAGFRLKPADTPAKLAHLQTLPQKQIVPWKKDGRVFYVFADPDQKALYVGDQQALQRFRELQMQQEDAREGKSITHGSQLANLEMDYESEMEWDLWGPYDPWW